MVDCIPILLIVDHGDRSFDESFTVVAKDKERVSSLVCWVVGFDGNNSSVGWSVQ